MSLPAVLHGKVFEDEGWARVEWVSQKRFARKHIFLTWSHKNIPFNKGDLETYVKNRFSNYNPAYMISEETCTDGRNHYHMLITAVNGCFDIHDKSRFDMYVEGEDEVYKPYIVSPKTSSDVGHVIFYMQKEDKDPIYCQYSKGDGKRKAKSKSSGGNDKLTCGELLSVCKSAKTFSEAMSDIGDRALPSGLERVYSRIQQELPQCPISVSGPSRPIEEFYVPSVVRRWYNWWVTGEHGTCDGRSKCLIVTGPPETAKTTMLRSLGPHLYYSSQITLQDFELNSVVGPEIEYLVIDDASGLFKSDTAYNGFGKQLLNAKRDGWRSKNRNLTQVACINDLPVIWIQNCNKTTYKFWEEHDPLDWKVGSTYVEFIPVRKDVYRAVNKGYLEYTEYRDKGGMDIVHEHVKRQALNEKIERLESIYGSYKRQMSDFFAFGKNIRNKRIEIFAKDEGISVEEAREKVYGGVDENEFGVYIQWESTPNAIPDEEMEEIADEYYYRDLNYNERLKGANKIIFKSAEQIIEEHGRTIY